MTPRDRAVLFWGVCIPVRSYLASRGDQQWLRAFAAAIGSRWLAGMESGSVGFFGGPAWWADKRAMHGSLWLAYAFTGDARMLWIDVLGGAVSWWAYSGGL